MHIELTLPACLLLGFVQLEGQLCQLGVTLRYPPVQLLARTAPALSITGGRADLAYHQAVRFYKYWRGESGLPRSPAWERPALSVVEGGPGGEGPQVEIEIELAIPAFMGLGSRGM